MDEYVEERLEEKLWLQNMEELEALEEEWEDDGVEL
tara:strand:- start:27066 stop:27173 length:108 start_codon:yes stop_codon:yes gene_type:complete